MDSNMINEAMIHGWKIEVWRTYEPRFGRGTRIAEELMGTGRIIKHTRDTIQLEDEDYYIKEGTLIEAIGL